MTTVVISVLNSVVDSDVGNIVVDVFVVDDVFVDDVGFVDDAVVVVFIVGA